MVFVEKPLKSFPSIALRISAARTFTRDQRALKNRGFLTAGHRHRVKASFSRKRVQ